MPSERAWTLARQNSGADAAVAAAAAVGKRPSLRVVPGAGAPAGHRRVWVKRRGTSHATSVLVESDELVDDLKTKVLNRFPTTLLRTCDPADLIFALPEETKTLRAVSPNVRAHGHGHGHAGSSSAPVSPNPRGLELHPEDLIVPLVDRYFPQGMTIADALDVYTAEQASAPPPMPLPPRQFKFRANPPAAKPAMSRTNSAAEAGPPATVSPAAHPPTPGGPMRPPRSASRSRSISRGRGRDLKGSPKADRTPPSSTTDSGVLLLPRQFRMVSDSTERVGEEEHASRHTKDNSTGAASIDSGATGASSASGAGGNGAGASGAGASGAGAESAEVGSNESSAASELEVSLTYLSPNNRSVNERVIVPRVNVLIVEDNVINQKILEAFMRRKFVSYAIAKNGLEAVAMWRQGGFHLILMDIQLPVMTGLEATKEIRRLECVNRIGAFSHADTDLATKEPMDDLVGKFKSPVIIVALTASSASKDKSEALAAGCNDFLTKPVNLLWLEQKILEWGCMQALIDFDGWKQWIRKSLDDAASTPPP